MAKEIRTARHDLVVRTTQHHLDTKFIRLYTCSAFLCDLGNIVWGKNGHETNLSAATQRLCCMCMSNNQGMLLHWQPMNGPHALMNSSAMKFLHLTHPKVTDIALENIVDTVVTRY